MKKLLIATSVIIILLSLYFIDNYFNFNYLDRPGLNSGYENLIPSTTNAGTLGEPTSSPATKNINTFRGPTGAPSVKGPSGPPPGAN